MTGSVALDVVIGLIFVYLLYSLLATIIQEIIATLFDFRSDNLKDAIERMLDDDTKTKTFSKAFYAAPIIKYFARDNRKPSYFAPHNFSKVILDILRGENPKPGDDFRRKIDESFSTGIRVKTDSEETKLIKSGGTYTFLQSLWADSHGDIDKFRAHLEQWFNDTMDRASGWYKRKIQTILFFIALSIAIIFNVDTLDIANKLANNPELRKQVVAQADAFLKAHPNLDAELERESAQLKKLLSRDSVPDSAAYKRITVVKAKRDSLINSAQALVDKEISALNGVLGIGIHNYCWNGWGRFMKSIAGWFVTALALSLGAPFWFDLLNKFMKLRSSVAVKQDDQGPDTGGKSVPARSIVTIAKG